MQSRGREISVAGTRSEADTAVAVAERGLDAWRAAKAAWLDAFAAFAAQEAAASPSGAALDHRAG